MVYRVNFPNLKGPRAPSQNCKKIPDVTSEMTFFGFKIINYSGNILERLDTISMSDGDHKLEIEMTLKIEDFDTVI